MEENRCPFFDSCPICGASGQVKLVWILSYCKTLKYEECARYKTRVAGEIPAFTLLPDATHMSADTEHLVREHVEASKRLAHIT